MCGDAQTKQTGRVALMGRDSGVNLLDPLALSNAAPLPNLETEP